MPDSWATDGSLCSWPLANPGPVTRQVLGRPEFERLRPDVERDLKRAVVVILHGLAVERR